MYLRYVSCGVVFVLAAASAHAASTLVEDGGENHADHGVHHATTSHAPFGECCRENSVCEDLWSDYCANRLPCGSLGLYKIRAELHSCRCRLKTCCQENLPDCSAKSLQQCRTCDWKLPKLRWPKLGKFCCFGRKQAGCTESCCDAGCDSQCAAGMTLEPATEAATDDSVPPAPMPATEPTASRPGFPRLNDTVERFLKPTMRRLKPGNPPVPSGVVDDVGRVGDSSSTLNEARQVPWLRKLGDMVR